MPPAPRRGCALPHRRSLPFWPSTPACVSPSCCCSAFRQGCRWRCRPRRCACGWPTAASMSAPSASWRWRACLTPSSSYGRRSSTRCTSRGFRLGSDGGAPGSSPRSSALWRPSSGSARAIPPPRRLPWAWVRSWWRSRPPRRTSSSTRSGSRAYRWRSRRPAWRATSPPTASACWRRARVSWGSPPGWRRRVGARPRSGPSPTALQRCWCWWGCSPRCLRASPGPTCRRRTIRTTR